MDKEQRVYCQARECTKTVYKRIHVVEHQGSVMVLGSQCYGKLYRGHEKQEALFTGQSSRSLTAEERTMLAENTAELVAQFEAERHAVEQERRSAEIENLRVAEEAKRHIGQQPPLFKACPTTTQLFQL